MRVRTVPVMGAIRSLTLLVDSIVAAGLTGPHDFARSGQGHVEYVAEGLLREVGHPCADQAGSGVKAGPKVICAVPEVSWDIGHYSPLAVPLAWHLGGSLVAWAHHPGCRVAMRQMARGPPARQACHPGGEVPKQADGAGLTGCWRDVDGR